MQANRSKKMKNNSYTLSYLELPNMAIRRRSGRKKGGEEQQNEEREAISTSTQHS
jgi:hypothetical protein